MPGLLIEILIVVLIVAVFLWAIGQFSMDPQLYKVVRVIVIVLVACWLIWLLAGFLPVTWYPHRR